jgi:hypothetical protein
MATIAEAPGSIEGTRRTRRGRRSLLWPQIIERTPETAGRRWFCGGSLCSWGRRKKGERCWRREGGREETLGFLGGVQDRLERD